MESPLFCAFFAPAIMNTAKLILGKKLRDGTQSVTLYLNLRDEHAPLRISLGVAVRKADWDDANGAIRGKDAMRTNLILQQRVALANRILTDYELKQRTLDRKTFLHEYRNPQSRESFLPFYEHTMLDNYDRRLIGTGTLVAERRTLTKLHEYSAGLLFSGIDRAWLEGFDAWHARRLQKAGYEGYREREKALKHVKKYLNAAKGSYDFTWPFTGFTWPKYKVRPEFLEQEDIRKLIALYDDESLILDRMRARGDRLGWMAWNIEQYACETGVEKVRRVLSWFLFQCFTGMRYGDVAAITWRHVEGEHLVFIPEKTKETSGAEVRMYMSAMIRKFMGQQHKHGQVFQVISNQKYNDYLKEIAELAGIDKRLTTHVGRHTFATMSLNRGVKVEVLKELMGVTSIKTLMIYVHITQKMQDRAMRDAYDDWK